MIISPHQYGKRKRGPLRRDWMARYKDYDYFDRYDLEFA